MYNVHTIMPNKHAYILYILRRFPWLIPTLTPEFIADSVVNAMLKNQDFVLTPRVLWLFYILKPFLPSKASLALADFLGITTFMEKFTGHGGQEKKNE